MMSYEYYSLTFYKTFITDSERHLTVNMINAKIQPFPNKKILQPVHQK